MKTSCTSDFAYVGKRPYIRGVDLLRFFLDHETLSEADRPYELRSLKLLQELRRNGVWTLADKTSETASNLTPSATIEYTAI